MDRCTFKREIVSEFLGTKNYPTEIEEWERFGCDKYEHCLDDFIAWCLKKGYTITRVEVKEAKNG